MTTYLIISIKPFKYFTIGQLIAGVSAAHDILLQRFDETFSEYLGEMRRDWMHENGDLPRVVSVGD